MKTRSDPNGRFIICDIKANGKMITLCNLYAPNDDKPDFFRDISTYLREFQCDEIIIGGDFNLVLDITKDKRGGRPTTHKNSLKVHLTVDLFIRRNKSTFFLKCSSEKIF